MSAFESPIGHIEEFFRSVVRGFEVIREIRESNGYEFRSAVGAEKYAIGISEVDAGSTLRALVFNDRFSEHFESHCFRKVQSPKTASNSHVGSVKTAIAFSCVPACTSTREFLEVESS